MERCGSVERANVDSKSFDLLSGSCNDARVEGDVDDVIDCPEIVQSLVRRTVGTVCDQLDGGVDVVYNVCTGTVRRTVSHASDRHDRPVTDHYRHRNQLDDILAVGTRPTHLHRCKNDVLTFFCLFK